MCNQKCFFNGNKSFEEVDKVTRNYMSRKTVNGDVDPLPKEILENPVSTALLYTLFDQLLGKQQSVLYLKGQTKIRECH